MKSLSIYNTRDLLRLSKFGKSRSISQQIVAHTIGAIHLGCNQTVAMETDDAGDI
jgi:hypothetical protein